MDWSASHTGFVIAAYALSVAFLALLAGAILVRDWRLRRQLAALESRRARGN